MFKMESMHLLDIEAWFPAYTSETKWQSISKVSHN